MLSHVQNKRTGVVNHVSKYIEISSKGSCLRDHVLKHYRFGISTSFFSVEDLALYPMEPAGARASCASPQKGGQKTAMQCGIL